MCKGLRVRWITATLLVALAMVALIHAPSHAQVVGAAELSTLTDEQVRRLLLQRLQQDHEAAARPERRFHPAITAYQLQHSAGDLSARLSAIAGSVGELPATFPTAWARFVESSEGGSVAGFFGGFVASMLGGWGLAALVGRRLRSAMAPVTNRIPETLGGRMSLLGLEALRRAIFIAVFAMTAIAAYLIFFDSARQFRTTFIFYLGATVLFLTTMLLSHAVFAPGRSSLRVPLFSDAAAVRFHRSVLITVLLGSFGFFTCALMGTLGISGDVHSLFLMLVGGTIIVGLLLTIFGGRKAIVTDLVSDRQLSPIALVAARLWPWLFMSTILIIWCGLVVAELLEAFVPYGGALFTIAALFVTPSLDAAIDREARLRIANADDVGGAILRSARLALWFGGALAIAVSWRFSPLETVGEEGGLAAAAWQIAVTLVVAYMLWQTIRITIDRKIREEDAAGAGDDQNEEMEIGGTGLSRIRTLLPLLRRTAQVVLVCVVTMIVLASLGVEIGPVLAGAGVVGIAIGFGSQTLVRDIVSGAFFLLDDAVRLGEYIDVGGTKGSVEKMSIRSLRLRHHLGPVHTIPFGEIKTLTNYSRDWVIMKLKFRVPFTTDIEKVRKLFKKAGQELMADPEVGADFLQPFKSQGVLEVDDYGLVLRAKFMAKPGTQFLIRRKAYAVVQRIFEENGIEFAKPIIKVAVEHDEGQDAERQRRETAVAGAAAAAATVDELLPADRVVESAP